MSLEKAKSLEAGLHTIVGTEYTEAFTEKNVDKEEEKKSFCDKLKFIFTNMTVEPILFCYILPGVMNVIATQNLSLEKSCRVNLNLGEDVCDALSVRNVTHHLSYKEDEENVQTLAAKMTVIKNVIQSVFPGVLLLFLGAWSDRHLRRKPCIIVPVIGDIVMCLLLMLCTYYFYQLPVEVNSLCEALPPALTGTWFAMFTGVYSYISDVSSEKERTLRVGAVNMITNISMCIGTALSGVLYEQIGFYGVYLVSLCIYCIGLTHGLATIKDTHKIQKEKYDKLNHTEEKKSEKEDKEISIGLIYTEKEPEEKSFNKSEKEANEVSNGFINIEKKRDKESVPDFGTVELIRDFFRAEHVLDTLKSVLKAGGKRGNTRKLYGIIFLFMVIVGPLYGELNVVYFFVRYKFEWDAVQYSFFSTFQFVTNTLGTIFSLMFFTKYLKLDDSILGMISCSSKVLAAGVYAFAPSPKFFYIGAIVECLNGTSFIAMRAMITKLVPPEELGKINSLFGVGEAIVPLIYGPLYSRLYAYTIDQFPGCFYIVGGGLTFPAIFIFYWLYLEHKKDKVFESKVQEETLLSKKTEVEA